MECYGDVDTATILKKWIILIFSWFRAELQKGLFLLLFHDFFLIRLTYWFLPFWHFLGAQMANFMLNSSPFALYSNILNLIASASAIRHCAFVPLARACVIFI
jgi:hypothetical protein